MPRARPSTALANALTTVLLSGLLAVATGCSEILAELDGGAASTPAPKEEPEATPDTPQSKLEKYYADQRREKRREFDPENSIVKCELSGHVRMTRKFDCISQGGILR